jgi:hypothetical protein
MLALARVARTIVLAGTAVLLSPGTLLAELPAHLSGTMLDTSNAPIAGAHVYVVLPGDRTIRTTTDVKGSFAVLGTSIGEATLILEKSGFASCVSSLNLESDANAHVMIHSPKLLAGSDSPADACRVVIRRVDAYDRHALN